LGLADWRWLPLAQIVGILAASVLALLVLVKSPNTRKILTAIFVSCWLLFSVVSIIPDFYKSLYWIVASAVSVPYMYLIPLYILVIVRSASCAGEKKVVWLGIIAGLLSLMVATTHEAGVVGWVAAQVFVLAASGMRFKQLKRWQILVIIGAAAGILGFALQVFSPGNLNRGDVQNYTRTVRVLPLIQGTLTFYFQYLRSITVPGWLLLFSLIGVGMLVPTAAPRCWKWSAAILVATHLIAASCFIVGVYVLSGSIPLRTQFTPAAYLAYGFFAAGLFLPRPGSKQLTAGYTIVFVLIAAIVGLPNLSRLADTMQPMRQFAQDWDKRDALGRQDAAYIYMIDIPWEEYEAKITSVQEYYRRIDAVPDYPDGSAP
jgi:hypothetical protein